MSAVLRIIVMLLFLTAAAYWTNDIVSHLTSDDFARWKLIPWMCPIIAAILAPLFSMWRARELRFANPFVYQTFTYLMPIFVIGSVMFIVTGVTDIPEAVLIKNPAQAYPAAMFYTAIAIAAFGIGVSANGVRQAGISVARRLPAWRWRSDQIILPGLILFTMGAAIKLVNFSTGIIGFQSAEIGRFTVAFFFVGLVFNVGQYLLWFAIFTAEKLTWRHAALAVMMLLLLPVFAALAGSRGYLFSSWLVVVLACATTGQRATAKAIAFIFIFGALSLALGIAFGSAFRAIKLETAIEAAATSPAQTSPAPVSPGPGSPGPVPADRTLPAAEPLPRLSDVEAMSEQSMRRLTVGEQFGIAREAASRALDRSVFDQTIRGVASRLNTLTQLTVVVARYEELQGTLPATLGSSIWLGITTALIPRAIWPEKPVIGDAKNYGTLFFEFSTNSFAMTPFGDLLINFGPLGIVPGMFLLGVLMRLLYASLIESSPGSAGRAAIYALLLSQLSMEGAFGTIIPWLLRTGVVAVGAILVVAVIVTAANGLRKKPLAHEIAGD